MSTNQQFTARTATLEDAQLIADLVNAVDLVDIGTAEYSAQEAADDLKTVTDSWLAFEGDRAVAWASVWNDFDSERIDVDHYVLRDAVDAGLHLVALMTDRAAELAGANGADEAVIHLHLTPRSLLAQGTLAELGWRAIRRHNVLVRPVSVDADQPPEPPPGVTLRTAGSAADQQVVHALIQDTFAAHFDYQPETYEQWRARMAADELDWSLVWIASVAEPGAAPVDAGILVGRNNRETMGWARDVGVRSAWRGRGIATLLLRTAFAEFARRGRHQMGLGVDTQNATNAFRLYEGLGMTLHFAADTWELRVPTPVPAPHA